MKRAAISFTDILVSVFHGRLDLAELSLMVFGCRPAHLVPPTASHLPLELGWIGEKKNFEPGPEGHLIPRDSVDPKAIEAYTKVWNWMQEHPQGIMHTADNYWSTMRHILSEKLADTVHFQHGWYDYTSEEMDTRQHETDLPVSLTAWAELVFLTQAYVRTTLRI